MQRIFLILTKMMIVKNNQLINYGLYFNRNDNKIMGSHDFTGSNNDNSMICCFAGEKYPQSFENADVEAIARFLPGYQILRKYRHALPFRLPGYFLLNSNSDDRRVCKNVSHLTDVKE